MLEISVTCPSVRRSIRLSLRPSLPFWRCRGLIPQLAEWKHWTREPLFFLEPRFSGNVSIANIAPHDWSH